MRMALVAVLLLLGAQAAPAQPEWADKLFANGGTEHDFGAVARGDVLTHRFQLTNIYAVPLQVASTRTGG